MGWTNQAVTLIVLTVTISGPSGFFIYDPTIAPGDLIISASAGGAGPEGETVGPGVIAYGTGPTGPGTARVGFVVIGGLPALGFASGASSESRSAQLTENVFNPNTTNEQIAITFFGPESTATPQDSVAIELVSSSPASPGIATGNLIYFAAAATNNLLSWGGKGLFRQSIAGLSGGIPLNVMDFFTRTANTTSPTALTTSYAIPANDSSATGGQQTTYQLHAWGTGTMSNPADTATISLSMFGTTVYTNGPATWANAGHAFVWDFNAEVMISGNSPTASFIVGGLLNFTDTVAGSNVTASISGGATVNNTAAGTMTLDWTWASVANSPTISCVGSVFTRKGV